MNRDTVSTAVEVIGAASLVVGVDVVAGHGFAWIAAGLLTVGLGYLIGGAK